jgi:hypothetical protein
MFGKNDFKAGQLISLMLNNCKISQTQKYVITNVRHRADNADELFLDLTPYQGLKTDQHVYQCIDLKNMLAIASVSNKQDISHINILNNNVNAIKSIHIPWLHKNTTPELVAKHLNNSGWGVVCNVDLKTNIETGNQYGFVHFSKLYHPFKKVEEYLEKDDTNIVKIYYNGTHHWMVKSVIETPLYGVTHVYAGLIIEFSEDESDDESDDEE